MDIAVKLREEGYKVTPQRLAIFNCLEEKRLHPTAEHIYEELRVLYPSMSLATVYKTMEIFARIGIIQILQIGNDSHRYDVDVTPHAHIRCTVCNRVDDLMGIHLRDVDQEVAAMSQYQIMGRQLYFFGVCSECLKKSPIRNDLFKAKKVNLL